MLLIKDESGLLVILYSSNQHLWYQKLHRVIEQQVKKLYCQVKLSQEEALSVFPEHETSASLLRQYPGAPICYQPSCGFCCDCADSSVLQKIFKRLVLRPKLARDEYLSMLTHA
jgi:hypothetical protein